MPSRRLRTYHWYTPGSESARWANAEMNRNEATRGAMRRFSRVSSATTNFSDTSSNSRNDVVTGRAKSVLRSSMRTPCAKCRTAMAALNRRSLSNVAGTTAVSAVVIAISSPLRAPPVWVSRRLSLLSPAGLSRPDWRQAERIHRSFHPSPTERSAHHSNPSYYPAD